MYVYISDGKKSSLCVRVNRTSYNISKGVREKRPRTMSLSRGRVPSVLYSSCGGIIFTQTFKMHNRINNPAVLNSYPSLPVVTININGNIHTLFFFFLSFIFYCIIMYINIWIYKCVLLLYGYRDINIFLFMSLTKIYQERFENGGSNL